MTAGLLDCIDTPRQGNRAVEGAAWCADNGCFTDKWDEAQWWQFLVDNAYRADSCVFATAPDVVGDAVATYERSVPWLAKIRELGYPVAYVGQNGATIDGLPWDDFDVLFLGGDDAWKLGPEARALTAEAKRRGKHVHMGRVNSLKRLRYAAAIGCDSADGTSLAFGPDVNLGSVLAWLRDVNGQGSLFGGAA